MTYRRVSIMAALVLAFALSGYADATGLMRMQKRDLALHTLLACVAWSVVGPLFAQDERIYWRNNYSEAIREAKQTQKPIFLEFRCEP